MATRFLDYLQEDAPGVPGIGVAALATLPVVGAAALGYRKLKSNTPVSASEILATHSNLASLGKTVGQGLRDAANLDRITEKFMESDAYDEMMRKTQQRNALIQTLLTTIDDPSAGFDPQKLVSLKDDLLRIANDTTDSEDARKIMSSAIKTIHESGSEQLQRRFGSRLREFSQVADELVAPAFEFKSGSAFSIINHGNMKNLNYRKSLVGGDLSRAGTLTQRYQRLMDIVGPGAERTVELVSAPSGMGQTGVYARLYSESGGGRNFITSIPLMGNAKGSKDATIFRLGENFQTGYFGPQGVVDFQEADKLIGKYGPGRVGLGELKKHGALRGVEDLYLDRLQQDLQRGARGVYLKDREGFNAFVREPLEVASRLVGPSSTLGSPQLAGYRRHIMNAANMQHNTIMISNLQRGDEAGKDRVMTGLVGRRDLKQRLDPGVGPSRIVSDYIEGRQHGLLQTHAGSALSHFRPGSTPTRLSSPLIARVEQVAGRTARWVGSSTGKMGRYQGFNYGAGAAPIEWSPSMTGLTNKAVLLDVTMGGGRGAYAATEGYGQAYVLGGVGRLESDFTVPLLDPKSHKNLSSRLQEFLHGRYQAGGAEEYFEVTEEGKLRHAISNTTFDPYLGQGPAGSRSIHVDPRAKGMWLSIAEANPANGKNQLQVVGRVEREMDRAKLFGVLHKGTALGVDLPVFMKDLATYGVDEGWLRTLNVPLNEIVAASGDMLKKAPDFLNVQMISGAGLVGDFGKQGAFRYVTSQVSRRVSTGAKTAFGGGGTGHVADVVMTKLGKDLSSKKITVDDAGRVLAGLYYGSGLARHHGVAGAPGAFFKGDFAMDPAALESRMRTVFGKSYDPLLTVMRKGLALGAGGFSAGTGHGDYGLGRGSVEPRFMEMMAARLSDAGMAEADISELMVGIYKRKLGGRESMEVVAPLERMVASHLSMTVPGSSAPVLSLDDFMKVVSSDDKSSWSNYLKSQKEGVFLDLGGGNTKASAAIAHAAGERFGGQRQLYFPGGDAMSLMKGAEIRQAGETIQVGSQYERLVDKFARDLFELSSSNDKASTQAVVDFQKFKKDTATLWANVFQKQAGGKIKGSAMNMMQGYATRSGAGLTTAQTATVQGLMRGSSGMAMFMDSKGFLSMLNDYMGSDKSDLLRMYFTGSETAWQQARAGGARAVKTQAGIMSLTMRNPILGYGNTNISQIYRDVTEVGRGHSDDIFDFVRKLHKKSFDELEHAAGRKIGGWGDVAAIRDTHGKAVDTFFTEMAGNLRSWVREGGGSIFMPDDRFTVTDLRGKQVASRVDFAFSGAAIGDFDGDWANTILLDKTSRRKLLSTLQDAGGMEQYLARNASVIAQGETYKSYAKEAIRHAATARGVNADEIAEELFQAQQDLLKEKGSKRSTGAVDISLNKLKRAVLNQRSDQNRATSNEALALLQMLEEHTTIKSKKLESFMPLGDMLTGAIDRAFGGEGVDPIRQLFRNTIFPAERMAELYSGITLGVESESGAALPAYVRGAQGAKVSLDSVLDLLNSAISNYKAIGGGTGESANMLASSVADSAVDVSQRAFNDLALAGTAGVQAGMARGYGRNQAQQALAIAEGAWGRVSAAAGKIDAKMAGLFTLGLGAGAAVLGMVGADGYDSQPLMMPGEMPSAYVQKGVGSFNLLDQSSARENASGPISDPYDMINTPVNTGSTYVSRNNGYNIHGEAGSMGGVGKLSSYLNTLTRGMGRGSIMVNDMRRPITSAYSDRLMGEY